MAFHRAMVCADMVVRSGSALGHVTLTRRETNSDSGAGTRLLASSTPPPPTMSSDGFFSDDLDSAFLDEADAIEAAHVSPPKPKPVAAAPPPVINIDDSDDYDISCNFDETDFQQLDNVEESAYTGGPSNSPGLRRPGVGRTPSMTVQRDLFGNLVTPGASTSKSAHAQKQAQPAMRTISHGGFGGAQRKIRFWDHTQYAKSGWKKRKPSKGKDRVYGEDGEEEEVEEEEPERLPAPFISGEHERTCTLGKF